MSIDTQSDVKQMVVLNSTFGPHEVSQLVDLIAGDSTHFSQLREAVGELEQQSDNSPATNVRLGVCQFILGRFQGALNTLKQGDGGAMAHFYQAKASMALERYDQAIKALDAATTAGYDADQCALLKAECLRRAGRTDDAITSLDNLSGAIEQTSDYLYQRAATVAALGGNRGEVIALYERAVDVDPSHAGALFGLALECERHGNDDQAMDLYERSVSRFPPHVGTLLNLGLLYEDREQYTRAAQCYQRILEVFPAHPRARLYLKDAQASTDMYYDEEAQRRKDQLSQVLGIPVTDFELSVRSRNCLQKMGINTLGDLCRTTEQHLLASKNFGETSLVEIREMLVSKGLELGQFADQARVEDPVDSDSLSADERALLDRPIADLNLSVRSRKCMIRLGIATIGELIRKKPDDLLESKNFGVTSLNEVREKLTEHELKLRGE